MKNLKPLTLPKPWRLLFLDRPQLDTSSSHYKAISLAFKNRNSRLISNDIVDVWEADQDAKTIKITLESGQEINATFQFVGTYDGQTFMWGDVNKSLKQPLTKVASEFRGWLKDNEWTYFQDNKFPASLRDMMALLSLAGDALKIENVYLASSGYNSYVALALDKNVATHLNLFDLFDGHFGIEDSHYIPKPKRETFEIFNAAYDVNPNTAMFFEDNLRNLRVPHDMGMATLLVTSDADFSHEPEAARPGAMNEDTAHVDVISSDLGAWLSERVEV